MGSYDSQVFIGGAGQASQQLGFVGWTATQAAYGSAGTLQLQLVLSDLQRQGIDLLTLAEAGLVEIEVFAPALTQVVAAIPGTTTTAGVEAVPTLSMLPQAQMGAATVIPVTYQPSKVFGGYLDVSDLSFRADEVAVSARDYSSLLMDQTIADARFVNYTVAQLVKTFAKDVGLNTAQTPQFIQGATTRAGHYLQLDHVQLAIQTTKWELLQRLARNLGFSCFSTPTKEMYFATPNALGLPPREYTYGKDIMDLKIRHSPRRNRSFIVVVNSYHPKQAKKIRSTYTQHGVGKTSRNLPIYEYFVEGMTQEQCTARASAIAQDIAKREIVVTVEISGDAGVTPWGGGVLIRNAHPALEGQIFNISSVTHSYQVPQSESGEGEGFKTTFCAWNLPPSSSQSGLSGV